MSYVVLALKWRPKTFADIVGQRHVVQILTSALQKGRLAHAYLLAGPRGVGKTSTARILSKALNCSSGPTVAPCGTCSFCREITDGRSLDVIEIDGASNTGVDEIRQLRESVKFAPSAARFKIYIIDEVHMLSTGAFNALLKTLEEPPGYVKFVFATTHPERIPTTVLSRCQRLDFRRIAAKEIVAQLRTIITAEKAAIDEAVLFAIAKTSDGSLRDAETMLDELLSFSSGKLTRDEVTSLLGLIEQEALFAIADAVARKDAAAALGCLNTLIEQGKDTGVLLAALIEHYRNLMVAKIAGRDPQLLDVPEETAERLVSQAGGFSLEEIVIGFNALVNAKELSRRLDSIRIPLEIALVKLTQPKGVSQHKEAVSSSGTSQGGPSAAGERQEKKVQQQLPQSDAPPQGYHKAALQSHETAEEPAASAISLDDVKEAWPRLIETIGKIKMSVSTYLNEGLPVAIQRNVLTVIFPKDYSLHKESLEEKGNRSLVEKILGEVFPAARLRIAFMLSAEPSSRKKEENPMIKTALEMFGGRLLSSE